MSAVNTLIFPVADLDAAKKVFTTLLGAQPHTDESYYVGYNVDGQEIALDPTVLADADGNMIGLMQG